MKRKPNRMIMLNLLLCLVLLCGTLGCDRSQKDPEHMPETVLQPERTEEPSGSAAAEPTHKADDAVCRVLFVNVGRADAALIQIGTANYLIDTGEDVSIWRLLSALQCMDVERLDGVFLTHTHGDHIGGFQVLAREYSIDRVYRAEISMDKQNGKNKIDQRAEKAGIPVTTLKAGDTVELGNGLAFEVIGPLIYNAEDDNDNSLVLRLAMAGKTFLFTGDMQFPEEQSLLNAGADLKADVLKVGNHGNPDATSDAFGRAVSPDFAVITTDRLVDKNSANARVIAALPNARVYVTDETDVGLLMTVSADGELRISQPAREETGLELCIKAVDRQDQIVTIQNNGADADISGCMLFSMRGGELFRFPEGTRLRSGESVSVSGEGKCGDFEWNGEKKPWSTKKDDPALLLDRYGNVLMRFD